MIADITVIMDWSHHISLQFVVFINANYGGVYFIIYDFAI